MKKYKSSDLTHKRAEVMRASTKELVLIQELNTNGDIRAEFVLMPREVAFDIIDNNSFSGGKSGETKETIMWNLLQPNNCHCGKCEECRRGDL